jgi:hypothetical protein
VDVERDVVLEELREDVVGPVDRIALGEVVEDLGREEVDPAVGEVRERLVRVGLLLEAGDPTVGVVQHHAVLARVRDLLDAERGDAAGLLVAFDELRDVEVGEGVAGDHEERLVPEELASVADPAGGAEQLLLLEVGQLVAEVVPDRVREVVEVRHDPVDPVAVQEVDGVGHRRAVQERHHRLRQLEGEGPESGSESGGEDHGGQHPGNATAPPEPHGFTIPRAPPSPPRPAGARPGQSSAVSRSFRRWTTSPRAGSVPRSTAR